MKCTIGFLGAGRMATALAAGLNEAGLSDPTNLLATDPSSEALAHFQRSAPGSQVVSSGELAERSDVLIVAVKPQQIGAALTEIRGLSPERTLVVSIAAGVTLATLAEGLPAETRLIRVMPNTPCLIRKGASGYSRGEHATPRDADLVARLLGAVGFATETPEKLLDAVTGLSGSGPAFVYTAIEALSDAGVQSGLPRQVALELAARTVAGAAEMVLATGEHPALLREAVTSPGGTTAAGLAALEEQGFRSALVKAVSVAKCRASELSEGWRVE